MKTPGVFSGSLHHSMADWDFFRVDNWETFPNVTLSVINFKSPPSSIFFGDPFREVYVMPKLLSCWNMKSGRMRCWIRSQIMGIGQPHFYIGITGVGDPGIRLNVYFGPDWWRHTRVTWWQGLDGLGDPATVVLLEEEVDLVWIYGGIEFYPPMAGVTNRVGIGSTHQSIGYMRNYDDTIIETWTTEPCY
ncbi:hypothetical protein ES705_35841 [subsurface metagenome]